MSNHSGSAFGGHYTAYCKHPESKEWHSFNDSRYVICVSKAPVKRENWLELVSECLHDSFLKNRGCSELMRAFSTRAVISSQLSSTFTSKLVRVDES